MLALRARTVDTTVSLSGHTGAMQESDPAAESCADKKRQWRITVAAIILGPILAVLISGWLFSPSPNLAYPNTSPILVYSVEQEVRDKLRIITIKITNHGKAPSENVYGWVEFPSGERPRRGGGHESFEAQVGA